MAAREAESERLVSALGASRSQRLTLLLVVALLGLFTLRLVSSPDVGFHLEAGNHILSGKGWPATDPFTFTVTEHAYIDTSWGYQVVLASLERMGGAAAMILVHVLLVVAIFTLVLLSAGLGRGDPTLLAGLLLLGGLAAEPRFEVRPEIWSYALLASLLYLLHRRAEGLRAPLWLLPPLFLLWANSHSLFILGWAALGCFLAGISLRQRRLDRKLALWSLASVAITLINPYGWRGVVFPFTLITRMQGQNVFRQEIGEFDSPLELALSGQLGFYLVSLVCFFAFALLVPLSLPRLWRDRRPWCVLLALVFLPLALVMVRNVPLAVVVCLPGTLWGLPSTIAKAAPRLRRWGLALLVILTLVLGARVFNDAYYVGSRRLERFGFGWNRLTLPVDAASYAERIGLSGRLLNHLNFGGYLMWARPEPVFIDGRLEVMGEAFFREYRRCLASKAGLEACAERYDFRGIVFPYRLRPRLLEALSRDRDWRLVYFDHLAAVFAREEPGVELLEDAGVRRIATEAPPHVAVGALPGLGGGKRTSAAAGWLSGLFRRQGYPSDLYARGLFHFMRGDPRRGASRFAKAIEESRGAYYEIYNSFGATLFALDRLEPARDCYRIVLQEMPFYLRQRRRHAQERLAEIERRLREASPQGAVEPS